MKTVVSKDQYLELAAELEAERRYQERGELDQLVIVFVESLDWFAESAQDLSRN